MAQFFSKLTGKKTAPDVDEINAQALKQLQEQDASVTESAPLNELTLEQYPELSPDEINRQFYESIFKVSLKQHVLSLERLIELDALNRRFALDGPFREQCTPSLPTIVPQVLRCLSDKNSSTDDFVKLIQQDPSVAAAVLKTANSAFFNPANKVVDSFQRAVVILGTQGLRSLLCTSMLQPISADKMAQKNNFGTHLWAHALRSGIIGQLLATQEKEEPFIGYLSGLFNNIGELTLFCQLATWDFVDNDESSHGFYYLQQRCGKSLSACIVKQWEIPGDLLNIIMRQGDKPMNAILQRAVTFSQAIHLQQTKHISQEQLEILMQLLNIPEQLYDEVLEVTQAMQTT